MNVILMLIMFDADIMVQTAFKFNTFTYHSAGHLIVSEGIEDKDCKQIMKTIECRKMWSLKSDQGTLLPLVPKGSSMEPP